MSSRQPHGAAGDSGQPVTDWAMSRAVERTSRRFAAGRGRRKDLPALRHARRLRWGLPAPQLAREVLSPATIRQSPPGGQNCAAKSKARHSRLKNASALSVPMRLPK